jgi:iron(III) transport system permease protein
MTTVSSVIFLYSPDTKLASVAAVNIEEAGFLLDHGRPAAALGSAW